jgi:hypothetical protein
MLAMQEANLLNEIEDFVSIKKQCVVERLLCFKEMRMKFIKENKTSSISPLVNLKKPIRMNPPRLNLETAEKNLENRNANVKSERSFPNIKLKNIEINQNTLDEIPNSNCITERTSIYNTNYEIGIKSKPLNTMYIKNLKTNSILKTGTSPQENSGEDLCLQNIKALSFVKLNQRLTSSQNNSILFPKSILLKKIEKSNLNNQTSSDIIKDDSNLNLQDSVPVSPIKSGNLIEAPTIDCLAMDNFNRSFNPQYYFTSIFKNKKLKQFHEPKKKEKKLDFLVNDECFYHSTEAESQVKNRIVTMNSPIKFKQLKKERLKNLYCNVSKKNHLSLLKSFKSKKDDVKSK